MKVEEALGDDSRLFERSETNGNSWIFRLFGVALESKKGVSKVTKVKKVVVASLHGGLAVGDGWR